VVGVGAVAGAVLLGVTDDVWSSGPVATVRVNVLPAPGVLQALIVPLSFCASRWLIASPRPVPPNPRACEVLVRRNG
jgi:hypothetical protein